MINKIALSLKDATVKEKITVVVIVAYVNQKFLTPLWCWEKTLLYKPPHPGGCGEITSSLKSLHPCGCEEYTN